MHFTWGDNNTNVVHLPFIGPRDRRRRSSIAECAQSLFIAFVKPRPQAHRSSTFETSTSLQVKEEQQLHSQWSQVSITHLHTPHSQQSIYKIFSIKFLVRSSNWSNLSLSFSRVFLIFCTLRLLNNSKVKFAITLVLAKKSVSSNST